MERRVTVGLAAGAALVLASIVVLVTLSPGARDEATEVALHMTASRYAYDPSNFTVERGTTVIIRLTSTDVTHGFAIPEFGVDERIPPGEEVSITFRAERSGTFEYFCTVFCGSGHPQHRGTLTVTA